MKRFFTNLFAKTTLFFLLISAGIPANAQQVMLQGFWWDYSNNGYQYQWGDYLAELSPRLREMGIDAVWIPPTVKNSGQGWVGYGPFDNYDLGDKYQKGFTGTALGTKDELLRMIAVMHANGMNVVQDVILNHVMNPGSATGAGGQDPASWDDKWKNFRYSSFASPVSDESATDYLARSGRFPKNWQNFHSNPAHQCNSGDICASYWGPDICYWDGAIGKSSNATYNPTQSSQYMRIEMRNWMIWYKKQSGFDGYRLDAVKHAANWAIEDMLWNVQHNAGWASGGDAMFTVGEYVGGSSELDAWCNSVSKRSGTFDFGLRGALYGVVSSGGAYDLGSVPAAQQGYRVDYLDGKWVHRTVPFVNNHDTFRPTKDSLGNYTGWDNGQELAPHIDPYDPRLAVVYAIAFAVDGTPTVFFEDLFDMGANGNRYNHDPKNAAQLPVRDEIANIIWCHQNLNFKAGVYKVRHQAPDLLIIERGAKAIVAVNDNWNDWKGTWIQTDFAQGTVLYDYSGANGPYGYKTVGAGGWVEIWAPPVKGSEHNGRRGYSIWGPAGISGWYAPSRSQVTTQEWEMANDLGDSHPLSLQQGGQLPANSTAWRTVGRIFVEGGKTVTYKANMANHSYAARVSCFNSAGAEVSTYSSAQDFTRSFTASATGWITIKAKNSSASSPGQKIWVIATYQAPADIRTATYDNQTKSGGDWALYQEMLDQHAIAISDNDIQLVNEIKLSVYPTPAQAGNLHVAITSNEATQVSLIIFDMQGRQVYNEIKNVQEGENTWTLTQTAQLNAGVYELVVPGLNLRQSLVIE